MKHACLSPMLTPDILQCLADRFLWCTDHPATSSDGETMSLLSQNQLSPPMPLLLRTGSQKARNKC